MERKPPAGATALQSIGYKELAEYVHGTCSLEEAAAKIKLNSRHYAKRQITWFKREKDAVWVEKNSFSDKAELFEYLLQKIRIFLEKEPEMN